MADQRPCQDQPLDGIRVVDFSQYVPGPYASRLLNDLGAEVVKVEPKVGDPMRRLFARDETDASPVYQLLNRGKTIARIDLKVQETVSAVLSLIADADVVLESYRPGALERLGLGSDTCRELNPGLVYCSLSGYGQDGPARVHPGHDLNYCAAAGMFSYQVPERPPLPLVADHSGAMNAVNAILAALVGRGNHGRGAHLDIALYEAILSWHYIAQCGLVDTSSEDLQLIAGGAACYNFYRTCDGHTVTLGALEPHFWSNFCETMGYPGWAARQFEALPQESLISEVAAVMAQLTLVQLEKRLGEVDCCFQPVPAIEEIYAHPQTTSRGVFSPDRYGYPGKIDDLVPVTRRATRELPIGDLPQWST